MTREDLRLATFLWKTYTRAVRLQDDVDPRLPNDERHIRLKGLMQIAAAAHDGFCHLVGRLPSRVQVHDLDPIAPAAWTQLPVIERVLLDK